MQVGAAVGAHEAHVVGCIYLLRGNLLTQRTNRVHSSDFAQSGSAWTTNDGNRTTVWAFDVGGTRGRRVDPRAEVNERFAAMDGIREAAREWIGSRSIEEHINRNVGVARAIAFGASDDDTLRVRGRRGSLFGACVHAAMRP